jgi:hypothetical protein
MWSERSKQLGLLLLSYSGPEPDLVRTAIARLAKDDLQQMEHLLAKAHDDYREVLRCADKEEMENAAEGALQGMTLNERLWKLGLFDQWDTSVAKRDRPGAISILKKCQLSQLDIERTINSELQDDL